MAKEPNIDRFATSLSCVIDSLPIEASVVEVPALTSDTPLCTAVVAAKHPPSFPLGALEILGLLVAIRFLTSHD